MYTRKQLQDMLEMARRLHFWDDVAHWQSELDRLNSTPSLERTSS